MKTTINVLIGENTRFAVPVQPGRIRSAKGISVTPKKLNTLAPRTQPARRLAVTT